MKNLIVANWKMNPASRKEAEQIFEGIKNGVKGVNVDVVVCPPFVFLPMLKGLTLGAQNVFYEDEGAFMGKISAPMLKDGGVKYVIIGHSEIRKLGETDETINKKIKKALEIGLKVILCIGETTEERDEGKKKEVLERQLKQGLDGVGDLKDISVAYEPIWAIGTGNNCSVEDTKESLNFIRKFVPENTRVLYGGSVKSDNSADYIKNAGANGLLVGGASLKPDEFIKIVKSAE